MKKYFEDNEELICIYSDKEFGNLSFKYPYEDVIKNRREFLASVNLDLEKLVTMSQPHDNKVAIVELVDLGKGSITNDWLIGFDGLVTKEKGIVLGVETADCLPIFFYEKNKEIIGAAHAGWKGVVKNIAAEVIAKFIELKAKNEDIHVQIGPHICQGHFEVKSDILGQFEAYNECILEEEGRYFVNLAEIVKKQLFQVGIKLQNINIDEDCTFCQNKYYSWRREKEEQKGAMLGLITLV